MKALFSGKVVVVDVYQGITIKAVNLNVPLPSVIALTEYVPQPNQKPAFTRRNVFLRDSYKCQYCSKLYRTHDLSLGKRRTSICLLCSIESFVQHKYE